MAASSRNILLLALIPGCFAFAGDKPASRPTTSPFRDARVREQFDRWMKHASELASKIESPNERTAANRSIAEVRFDAGQISSLTEVIKSLQEAARLEPDEAKRRSICQTIALTHLRNGDLDAALASADEVEPESGRDMVCYLMVGRLLRAGEWANARLAIERLRASPRMTSYARVELAKALASAGIVAEATKIVDLDADSVPDDEKQFRKDEGRSSIAVAQAKAGDAAGARATADAIDESSCRAVTYLEIAEALAARGQIAEAWDIAGSIPARWDRAEAYAQIAVARADAGGIDTARQALDQAVWCASEEPDWRERSFAANDIAIAYAKLGDIAEAKHILSRLQSQPDDRSYWVDTTLSAIAQAQAKAGDDAGARQTVSTIKDPISKGIAIRSVVRIQARAGRLNAALRTAGADDDRFRHSGYADIAEPAARAGHLDAVDQWIASVNDPNEQISLLLAAARGLLPEEASMIPK